MAGDLLLPAPQQIGREAEIPGDLGGRMSAIRPQFHGLAFEFSREPPSFGSTHDDHLLDEHAPPSSRRPQFRGKITVLPWQVVSYLMSAFGLQ